MRLLRFAVVSLAGVLTTILVALAGCKKPPKECNAHIPLHPMAYDYFVFKPGSYWIYKETISGAIDSVWVKNMDEVELWAYRELGTKDCPCFKRIGIEFKHSYFNIRERIGIGAVIKKDNKTNISQVELRGNLDSTISLQEIRFNFIADTGRFSNTTGSGLGNVSMQDSFGINNQTYYKVFKLKYPQYYRSVDWVVELYQAKHIGVVKFVDYQYRSWELVRYKVYQ